MPKQSPTVQAGPNLWHFSAVVWGISNLLLSLFAMPISFNPPGLRLQLGLGLAHLAGVLYLWRRATKRGNPERLMEIAVVTLVFIYIVPLSMLVAPVIVLAAYGLPAQAWQTVVAIMLACAAMLAVVRLRATARSKRIGRQFDYFLSKQLKGNVITAGSIHAVLNYIGRHATGPSRIDGWSMLAAVVVGVPILSANIDYDKSSSSLAICALVTTPMAMHTLSRMVVHIYLWLYRLRRFERRAGFRIVVNLRNRS